MARTAEVSKSDEDSEGALERASPDEAGKETFWHITDSFCVCPAWASGI
jgi:hypothetical protein